MRSMTGYGRARENTSLGIVTVELTSVNHRNLDIRLRFPDVCRPLEIEFREIMKNSLRRGHVEGTIKIERDETSTPPGIALNIPVAITYFNEIKKLHETLGIDSPPEISWILDKPEVWQSPETPETGEVRTAILPIFEEALSELVHSRKQEGKTLNSFFIEKLKEIDPILKKIEAFMPTLPHLVKESLTEKLKELKQDPTLNPDRLAQEIAYLAQRADITEEFSRLSSHVKAFREKILKQTASGRELDFILQEMNREVNTMGSKSVSYDLSSHVIQLKEILNQIREQVQNVE